MEFTTFESIKIGLARLNRSEAGLMVLLKDLKL